jgi:deoxyhypusine synthase
VADDPIGSTQLTAAPAPNNNGRVTERETDVPHRRPGAPNPKQQRYLSGQPIRYYRPRGSAEVRTLIDQGFQAFNAGRLSEACHVFADRMLDPAHDTTIGMTLAGALTPAGLGGCVIELMERGLVDFLISTGANLYHDLHYALNFTLHRGSPFLDEVDLYDNGIIRIYDVLFPADVLLETDAYVRDFLARQDYDDGRCMIDPNRDVNEVCAIILGGEKNGCVILGGGSPKNFYLQGQPTLWEVYGIPKGGNEFFIQFTMDQPVWGGLSGATPAEAVSWGKVNPGQLPDTVVAYCDSTIAFPLFCEYVVGSDPGRRPRKELVHQRDTLVADLKRQASAARRATDTSAD